MAHRSWFLGLISVAIFVLTAVALVGQSSTAGEKKKEEAPSIVPVLPPNNPFPPIPPPVANTVLPPPPINAVEAPPEPKRFLFKIDPKTPLSELLPTAPKTVSKRPPLLNEDLRKVPEITFGDPIPKTLEKEEALKQTAHILAKVNHLNAKKKDGFMEALIAQRPELHGMPFLMGEECRTREAQAQMFALAAETISTARAEARSNQEPLDGADRFWTTLSRLQAVQTGILSKSGKTRVSRDEIDGYHRAVVAAMMQILAPDSEQSRQGLATFLATVPHLDATKALAKLVLFSPEEEVRSMAIAGLKLRREQDYTDILIQGFHYPLPAVAKRAAEALVKLERKDLLVNLVDVLERPDPRLPTTKEVNGKKVSVVRELVKVNHHRNCVLCHAPGNTPNLPDGILTVAVPLPSEPLPKPTEGGYQSTPLTTPDILVRIDMTYLRQDFSLMMPVADAEPWPDLQRFDFLVRTRVLSEKEAQDCQASAEPDEPGRLSPYHRAALFALRELTARDTEPNAAAWRRLLKLPSAATP